MPNSRHSPAIFSPSSSRAMNFSRSSIGLHSFQGIFALPQKARLCNPCARNELSPLSQEGQAMYVGNPKSGSVLLLLLWCLSLTRARARTPLFSRSEEHTSELQSLAYLVC